MILSHFLGSLHLMLYPINTLQKSNRTRNDQVKSKVVISVFPLSINKKKIYFFYGKYKIYFISCGENISIFTRATRS